MWSHTIRREELKIPREISMLQRGSSGFILDKDGDEAEHTIAPTEADADPDADNDDIE